MWNETWQFNREADWRVKKIEPISEKELGRKPDDVWTGKRFFIVFLSQANHSG
jgi:hypothetical protein